MRRPSDRAQLWERWRRRVAGDRALTINVDAPECGRYMAKRRGQWTAVQIDIEQEIEDGELVSDERFVAWLGEDKFTDEHKVHDIWLRCSGRPISDEEYRRLMKMPKISDLTRSVIT